jgi:N-acetylglucosamine kinase-like BadF-type ATPase
MRLFLAIDAGGSRTQSLLADETRVLARATTGTVKLMRVGEPEATARLQAMLAEIAAAAGVSLSHISRTCFGLAGISSPAARAWASRVLSSSVAGELLLCGDEEIALDAAFAGGPGILVVAGTGSNAIGRTAAGEIFGAGGWGPVLGDEGSGHWIGLEAIRAALRAHDREPLGDANRAQPGSDPTSLLREIERHWKLNSLGELVAYANRRGDCEHPAPEFASLAPVVARCAEQGDALAAEVLTRAGEQLAELVARVFGKMAADSAAIEGQRPDPYQPGASPQETGPTASPRAEGPTYNSASIGIAFTGGVLTHITPVRAAMTARLAVSLPMASVRQTPVDPLEGALWRARKG